MTFAGDNPECDVTNPLAHGIRAVLARPHGLHPGEILPDGIQLIQYVRDLPALLGAP